MRNRMRISEAKALDGSFVFLRKKVLEGPQKVSYTNIGRICR
jgi:hypothetical protein